MMNYHMTWYKRWIQPSANSNEQFVRYYDDLQLIGTFKTLQELVLRAHAFPSPGLRLVQLVATTKAFPVVGCFQ